MSWPAPLAVATSRQKQQWPRGRVQVTDRGRGELSAEKQLLRAGGPWGRVQGVSALRAGRGLLLSACVSARRKARDAGARVRARAGVCQCVSEGVTEAPTCPARQSCGRQQAAGEGEAAGAWGTRARSPGPAPHLPAPPPLDAEAAAVASLRPPCAPGGGREGLREAGFRAKQNKSPRAIPYSPNLRNRKDGHHLPAPTTSTPPLSQPG